MTTKELARKVRALLADPAKWHKGSNARDAKGEPCHPCADRAVAWCLYGATDHCDNHGNPNMTGTRAGIIVCRTMSDVARRKKGEDGRTLFYGPSTFNDAPETTHADVLDFLDRVIEEADAFEAAYYEGRMAP